MLLAFSYAWHLVAVTSEVSLFKEILSTDILILLFYIVLFILFYFILIYFIYIRFTGRHVRIISWFIK